MTAGSPFVHRLRVRTHECDAQGIVFNANWFTYFDVAITELLRAAFGSYGAFVDAGGDLVLVEASARFRAPGRFDDGLDIEVPIEHLGNTSMIVAPRARRDEELLVEGRIAYVYVEPSTMAKREIPAPVRDRLAPWVTGADG